MKKINNSELFNSELDNLEEQLQELFDKSEKILGYKSEGINETVKKLLYLNTKESKELANDILEIENDIISTEEFFTEEDSNDDPFLTLYDEDEDF